VDHFAYLVKQYLPFLFPLIEWLARGVTRIRFGRAIESAQVAATLNGTVGQRAATIRPLGLEDSGRLHAFLDSLPEKHLKFFHPHGFGLGQIKTVLASRAYANYGIFVDDELVAYALLKLAPTATAYIGLLVCPEQGGLGLGKFIVHYLYWQASLAELRTRSTISRQNPGSLRCHEAVSEFRVVAELPNHYVMIEFPQKEVDPPRLELGSREKG
jgi:hypothetical protein